MMRRQSTLSIGQSLQIQRSPAAAAFEVSFAARRVQQARELADAPVFWSGLAGHEPSANWAVRINAKPREIRSLCSSACSVCSSARSAQHVGSTRLANPARNAQPPSSFWLLSKIGRLTARTNDVSVVVLNGSKATPFEEIIMLGFFAAAMINRLATQPRQSAHAETLSPPAILRFRVD